MTFVNDKQHEKCHGPCVTTNIMTCRRSGIVFVATCFEHGMQVVDYDCGASAHISLATLCLLTGACCAELGVVFGRQSQKSIVVSRLFENNSKVDCR